MCKEKGGRLNGNEDRTAVFIHKRCPTTSQRGSFCLLCFQPGPMHSSLNNLLRNDYSNLSILTSALVRTLDRHARSSRITPVHAHPTRQAALVATLTEIRHDPLPKVPVCFPLHPAAYFRRSFSLPASLQQQRRRREILSLSLSFKPTREGIKEENFFLLFMNIFLYKRERERE